MSAHHIPVLSKTKTVSTPVIFASKRNRVSVAKPFHGQTGWRVVSVQGEVPTFNEVFFYGKGGFAEWLSREEFERRKAERAAVWKIANGLAHHRARRAKWERIEMYANCAMELET